MLQQPRGGRNFSEGVLCLKGWECHNLTPLDHCPSQFQLWFCWVQCYRLDLILWGSSRQPMLWLILLSGYRVQRLSAGLPAGSSGWNRVSIRKKNNPTDPILWKGFFIYITTLTINEINIVHKEKVIKLKCLLYTNSILSVGYWWEVVFVLTFFGLAACLVIFAYQALSTTHVHAECLIQSPTGFLSGWCHICPVMFSSRWGLTISYSSTITVWFSSLFSDFRLSGFVNDICACRMPDSISDRFSQWMMSHLPSDVFLTLRLDHLLHINNHCTDRK